MHVYEQVRKKGVPTQTLKCIVSAGTLMWARVGENPLLSQFAPHPVSIQLCFPCREQRLGLATLPFPGCSSLYGSGLGPSW